MTSDPAPETEPPRLPGLRSWRSVYWLVFGVFCLWVALLTWLTVHYG